MAFNLADVLKNVSDSDTAREQIEYISLGLIDEDPNNFYQLTEIPTLADNISLCGLQQPILMLQSGGCDPQYEKWRWDGMFWRDWSGQHDPILDGDILGWIPLPKLPERPQPASNESCITGMSPSGHCGAAAYCPNEYACCLQCPDESCNGRCGWPEVEAER